MDVNSNSPIEGLPVEIIVFNVLLIFLLLVVLVRTPSNKNPGSLTLSKKGAREIGKSDFYEERPGEYFDIIQKSPRKEMKTAFASGLKIYRESRYEGALQHFKEPRNEDPSNEEMAAIYNTEGLCNWHLGDLDIAKGKFESVLDHTKNEGAKAAALGNIGLIYADKGEPDKPLEYYGGALKIFRT